MEAALGGLTLASPDPAKRIAAAQSVFKSHDEAHLPSIDGALAKETNKAAKLAFTEARAAILLFKPDATEVEKLEAIATIKATGDQEALALLTGLTGDLPPAMCARRGQRDRRRSRARWRCGRPCRTPGTACRSARCCCWPRSVLPSPSASWASSTWPMARW